MTRSNCADQSITNRSEPRRAETDHQAAELENERTKLVQTVLDIRTRREQAEDAGIRQQAQRLLSAAMEDLARHDAALGPDSEEAI